MFKRFLAVLTATFVALGTYAIAAEVQQAHPDTYTVRKGDTLWDIAGKFLKRPWQWPEIWQANPQIKNPHLIYPGDIISLAYLNGRPVIGNQPGIRADEPIDVIDLSQIRPWLKQLTIVQDHKSLPYVVGMEEDRLMTSAGQVVYVRGLSGATPGQMVQVARPMQQYFEREPRKNDRKNRVEASKGMDLDHRGDYFLRDFQNFWSHGVPMGREGSKGAKFLGTEMMLHSLGEVTQIQGEVAVVVLRDDSREVRVGDRVLPVEAQPYDAKYFPHAPAAIAANPHVLAVADNLIFSGPRQVVALSVGSADGVKNGTVFSIWNDGVLRPDDVAHKNEIAQKQDRVQMPDDFVGRLMVFRTFDKVSYALVMESIRPTRVGNHLKHPDATQ